MADVVLRQRNHQVPESWPSSWTCFRNQEEMLQTIQKEIHPLDIGIQITTNNHHHQDVEPPSARPASLNKSLARTAPFQVSRTQRSHRFWPPVPWFSCLEDLFQFFNRTHERFHPGGLKNTALPRHSGEPEIHLLNWQRRGWHPEPSRKEVRLPTTTQQYLF